MLKKRLILLFFLGSFVNFFPQSDSARHVLTPHVDPALKFTENVGQWDDKILFRSQLDGGGLFVEKNCLTFSFYDKKKYRALHHGGILKGKYKDQVIKCHAYKINFDGCNANPIVEKAQKGPDYENFFIGNDKKKWKSNVNNYHQVWLRELYNGIDYEAITSAIGLKYNFYVKPNASTENIRLRYEGVDKIKLKDGALIIKLEVNEVIEQKPYAYQLINGRIKKVVCNYKLKDDVLTFEFPNGYDKRYTLVIDPTLIFAAQSGSTSDNFGMTATFDAAGNLYSGGTSFGNGYPVTPGAFSTFFSGTPANGNTDVIITKYNATGSGLIYATYLGGLGSEIVTSLIVDGNNNLCFYGATGSSNFPVTTNAYDVTFNGGVFLSFIYNGTTFNNGTDIYVGKLNSSGSTLLACTYLGGSDNDGVNHVNHTSPLPFPNNNIFEYQCDSLQHNYGDQYRGEIQVDILNNIYIASSTRSSNFPTVNPFDNSLGGKQDAIVAKFNSSLTQLLYCTYLGGSLNDCGNSLIVNSNFEVYVTGGTCSSDFPTTAGAHNVANNGGIAEGYLFHLNPGGNTVMQSTFLGTGNYDQSFFVQTDRNNNIYVYGQSQGNMGVVNAGTVVPYSNPNTHQFIRRYNSTLSNVNLSTVFGSNTASIDISPSAFAVDKCDNIYLSGWGGPILPPPSPMAGMPMQSPTQSTTDGQDFYLMGLSPNAATLLYGSYFGGNLSEEHVDGGTSRFDPRGVIYQSVCAGCGGNDDFPVTPGAWPNTPGNPNHAQNCNNGVFKIDFQLLVTVSTINTNTVAGCVPLTVSFTNATQPTGPGSSYIWYLGPNTNTTSTIINPTVTYTTPGTYTISLVVNNPASCNIKDSSITFITVYPKPTPNFSLASTPCNNTITTTNSSSGTFTTASPYSWNFGDGSPVSTATNPPHTYLADGIYTVALTVTDINGCSNVKTNTVAILNFTPGVVNSPTICNGENATITAAGGTSYTWSPASQVSNPNIANPVVTPTTTAIYTVVVYNNLFGNNCMATLTTNVIVNPKPTASFNFTINPCGGGVYFNDLSTVNIAAWQWTLSPAITSTIQNPYNFYNAGGTFSITLIATNTDGCKDTYTNVISVPVPPPVSVSGASIICRGGHAQLGATGGVSYQWTPAASLDLPFAADPSASPSVSTQYSVIITSSIVVGGNPCQFLLTTGVNVTQLSSIPVSANANPVIVTTGSATTLTYVGDPGALVTWLPPGSTIPGTGYTVTAYPDRPTTYTVIATKGACKEYAQVSVEAFSPGCIDNDVFVPNTFTPNGDGKNDLLYVRGIKVDEVYFAVYNRWGEKVFETTDKTKGWDGIYKSRPADVGVFGWYLKVKCINGDESFKKGNVTLIR